MTNNNWLEIGVLCANVGVILIGWSVYTLGGCVKQLQDMKIAELEKRLKELQ